MDKQNDPNLLKENSKSIANDNQNENSQSEILSPPPLQLKLNSNKVESNEESINEEAQLKSKQYSTGADDSGNDPNEVPNDGSEFNRPAFQLKPKNNNTGLPDDLKSGVESLSGYSLNDVNVHFNSDKPAQLNASAFAQGTDIHVGPGQEQHLPHEAWHVVQQKQGRVSPTIQQKGIAINDNQGLEKEADVMGEKAVQLKTESPFSLDQAKTSTYGTVQAKYSNVVQRTGTPEEFIAHGQYGPQEITPPTGIGGFSALYNPNTGPDGSLLVYISTHANFRNGLSIDGSNNVTDNTGGDLSQAVTDIMAMPANRRATAVAGFQWTEAQKTTHRALFATRMNEAMNSWSTSSHGMRFYVDKTDWEDIQASVTCVPIINETASGIEHINTDLWKVPDDNSYTAGAFIGTNTTTGRGNTMSIDSTHTNMTDTNTFLQEQVFFRRGSARLSNAAKTQMQNFVMLYQDSSTNSVSNKIKLIGRASSTGNRRLNERLARRRMAAVKRELMKNVTGPSSGANFPGFGEERIEFDNQAQTGAGAGAEWQRVDIVAGSGQVQHTIMHELGHVFGLDDEYVSDSSEPALSGGTGGVTGTATGHDQSSHAGFANSGADASTYEMNDSIMSVGNEVRSQHMVTFNFALRTLTSTPEWKIRS